MKSISRRHFVKSSFAGAAACGLSSRSGSQVLGANDDIRVAVVGLNGRGGSHLDEFSKSKRVRVTAPCDFDLWLGPAPKRPFHRNLVHYNWHWFWDFGNGDIGNQGVHEIDIARWALGGTLPQSVVSLGGRYVDEPNFKDQGETPNQLVSVFDYGDTLLLFETRGLVENAKIPEIKKNFPNKVANELFFESGVVKDGKFFPGGKGSGEPLVKVDYHVPSGGHFGNFINCVRNRKRQELAADIQEGHLSSALCHLGNISYRLAKERPFEKPKDFSDNAVVGESIMTLLENTQAIGVDPKKATLWVGPKLRFDPAREQFVENPKADA